MNQQRIQEIYELLETIKEALDYLFYNEDEQVLTDVKAGRGFVTDLLETEANRPIRSQIEADKLSDADWLQEVYKVLEDIEHPLVIENRHDSIFAKLIDYIWKMDVNSLVTVMKNKLQEMDPRNVQSYVDYFARFPLWGVLNPAEGNFETFEARATMIKQRSYEFLWLYKRLEDYTSKRTLYAILLNWTLLDTVQVGVMRSAFDDYYEPDIFENNHQDVFVDVGAFTGDSISQYIKNYGLGYSKIFAYEISEESCGALYENTKQLHDVAIRKQGVGKEKGYMTLIENADASANKLEAGEKVSGVGVEIVALDEELAQEEVTFIKMDIEGAEQDALLGCQNIIANRHPKLAICTYHGYEDIWKIPAMIDAMNPEYKFYMRHYGGNLFPTEFVLLCK